jgi:ABC-type Zn uptake system ZnuABC Zn-binding protein ZnuA
VVENFLADIVQNVTGEGASVESLIPAGLDPHAFEPTPGDVAKIAGADVLVINGGGFEEWLQETLDASSTQALVIDASAGLTPRVASDTEKVGEEEHESDPHFWLDPTLVVTYVENIRDGLIAADPQGEEVYTRNAQAYITKLEELDAWIQTQAASIPAAQRLMVTNHESFGYFADRYGFEVVGAIVPSVTTGASPSAQQVAGLVEHIRDTGARAIFLETGANPELADQVAGETGVQVVTGLYTHSLSEGGEAATYLDMMRFNTNMIVEALK